MKIVNTIMSLGFALLVFTASSSFIVGIHHCGGSLQQIALFHEAPGCVMEMGLPPCHSHMTAPCCDDETVVHDGQDFQYTSTTLTLASPFIAEIVSPAVPLAEIISSNPDFSGIPSYSPPWRTCDLTVSLQVFRI